MHFTIDLFAPFKNSQCQIFYSNFWCEETLGIDAFCHNWNREIAWICPPIKLIIRVIQRIKISKISGVLLVPEWQTSYFWPEIFDQNKKLTNLFRKCDTCRPFLAQETFNHWSPFSGQAKIDFLALYFSNVL
jgi:hypothetical protein